MLDKDLLIGEWHHAMAQDTDSSRVYVPLDVALPPARFRHQATFRQDGTLLWLALSPNDAHRSQAGTWKWVGEEKLELMAPGESQPLHWRVISLSKERLEVVQE